MAAMPTYVDAEGITITTYEWTVDSPKAVVQISHGIGEHARRYAPLAHDLNAAGYAVVADDHRGHGQTGIAQWSSDPSRLGRLGAGGLRATIGAVHRFSELTRAAHPAVPLVLLGHSWGSLMAQISINAHAADYDAVVLTGSAYRMPGWMDAGDLNRKHQQPGGSGAEWLSRDPAVAIAWLADELTFPAEVRKLFGVRDGLRLYGRPAKHMAPVPLLLMSGDDDTLGGAASVRRLAKAYRERSGQRDVTARIYAGARHEVFNETNRDEVIADLVRWLDARFAANKEQSDAR
jgi:alpha-beta hydrolase superfamily lysophospholipase